MNTPNIKAMPIDNAERERRKEAVDFARGSVRLEGIILDPEIEDLNVRYVNGEFTNEEHTQLVLDMIDQLHQE